MATPGAGPVRDGIPIVVGVTGHRDISPEHEAQLEGRVREALDDLSARCPSCPIVLLTGLAEGADRIAARAALGAGHAIAGVLPMDREEYERDFATEASRAEFRELSHQAVTVRTLPDRPDGRDAAYSALGVDIAKRCTLLIALWDGEEAGGQGGTADVVGYKLKGGPVRLEGPGSQLLDPPETGVVVHIATPRASDGPDGSTARVGLVTILASDPDEPERTHRKLRRLEQFNRDMARTGAQPGRAASANVERSGEGERLFIGADGVANDLQAKSIRTLHALVGFSFLGSICFGLYSSLYQLNPYLLGAYLAFLLASFVLWHVRIRRHEFESRYLDARALSEGLRVQLYWRRAGLPDEPAERYLRKQRGELDWIRTALRAVDLIDHGARGGAREEPEAVLREWVADQGGYFDRAGARSERAARRASVLTRGAYTAALGMSTLLFGALVISALAVKGGLTEAMANTVLASVAIFLVVGVLAQFYATRRVLGEHAKRYARMRLLLDGAERAVAELERAAPAVRRDLVRRLLLELGSESLGENADWLMLHRERPTEVAL